LTKLLVNVQIDKLVKEDRTNFLPYILVMLKEACKKKRDMWNWNQAKAKF